MRTLTHTQPGRVHFGLRLDVPGTVSVLASDDETATVTLEPVDPDDATTRKTIEAARVASRADRFDVTVPAPPGGTVTTTALPGGGVSVSMVAGTVTGSVTGVTITGNGNIVVGGNHGNGNAVASNGIRVRVRLPRGSSAQIGTTSANVTTQRRLAAVTITTVSGDVNVDTATQADITTTSGDVVIGGALTVGVTSVSGDVDVRGLSGSAVLATVSGDIAAHAVADSAVSARTVSGDITVTNEPGVTVKSRTRTVSGRVRDRRR